MPKLKNPPQGGEKYLCLTLFLTMFLSVVSAVAIIYSIVIIYLPSKIVLESNITGKNIDLVSLWVIQGVKRRMDACIFESSHFVFPPIASIYYNELFIMNLSLK